MHGRGRSVSSWGRFLCNGLCRGILAHREIYGRLVGVAGHGIQDCSLQGGKLIPVKLYDDGHSLGADLHLTDYPSGDVSQTNAIIQKNVAAPHLSQRAGAEQDPVRGDDQGTVDPAIVHVAVCGYGMEAKMITKNTDELLDALKTAQEKQDYESVAKYSCRLERIIRKRA